MAAFGLVPDDPKQALRVRRYLMAAGTSLLAVAVLFIGYSFGMLPWSAAVEGTAIILGLTVLFYLLFASGLNRRFRDPSLTTEMILCAVVVLAYMMYQAQGARDALSLFYLVAMLFGVLRLSTARLMMVAGIALLAHATMLYLAALRHPGTDPTDSLAQLAVLAIVLPWFAAMGGYVNDLRARLSDSNRQLQEAVAQIGEIAIRDELTGVYNRRFLVETLRREMARAARHGALLSLCLFDIDHFKRVNDSYGHAAGDAVLKRFTEIARTGLRGVDVLARHGGEEFLLVLPDTGLPGAVACTERIRANVEREDFPAIPPAQRVTVTAGVACVLPAETMEGLLARADAGLYRGKQEGRNRVVAVG